MLNTLRSILRFSERFYKHCNPFVYQILARMLSFFEKLKPAIKDVMISDCSFYCKMQILYFLCPSVLLSQDELSRVQAYRLCEKTPAFPVCLLRKLKNFNAKTQISNCLYKFRRLLSTPVPKLRFLASLIKIHYISLIFIHVNSVLLHGKTKRPPPILPVAVFSLPLGNKSLELYYCLKKI